MRSASGFGRVSPGPDEMPQGASPVVIAVEGLWKRYGATEAVRGVSFEVGAGQIFGLLGPNGAGKTTTLECVLGLRQPDGGSIRVNGWDPLTHGREAKLRVGAQLQAAALQEKLTPREALDFFGSFYAESIGSEELLGRFDLEEKADAAFGTLSGGQRQRLFLALAVVNRPTLVVLDEPTAGLDPRSRRRLRGLIEEMRAEGRTVLLSTHDLEEASQLCDRVAILDGGRIIACAPPGELTGRAQAPGRVIVRTEPALARSDVDSLPGVMGAVGGERGWMLETVAPHRLLAELPRRCDEVGAELLEVEVRRPSLEDVFLELTGRPWSEEEQAGSAA